VATAVNGGEAAMHATAGTFPARERGDVVHVVADHGRGILEQRGDEDDAALALPLRLQGLGVVDLQHEGVLEHMHAALVVAFGGHGAALVATISVVGVRAPQRLERGTVVSTEMHDQTLYPELARIDLELVARDETHVPQVGWKADE